MLDPDLVDELMERVKDKYTAPELVDDLDLDIEDIINAFWDTIIERRKRLRI